MGGELLFVGFIFDVVELIFFDGDNVFVGFWCVFDGVIGGFGGNVVSVEYLFV